ncbi:MAG: hypothetical protein IPI67_34660 [Myxococcales bacterium]|nr:hypothetical protein [Myxococcales bacterium]
MRAAIVPISLALVLGAGVASAQDDAAPADGAAPTDGAAPADETPAVTTEAAPKAAPTEAATAEAKPKKPPYSLPWQLRPIAPGNVARLDTSIQMYKPKGADSGGNIIATSLLFAYKVTPDFAPLVRLGYVTHSPSDPPGGASGSAFLNPVIGGLYGIALSPEMKLGLFLGLALPLGSNGGNSPNAEKSVALAGGMGARRYMDNAMFATNYFTPFPGVGFAYVASNLTIQAEVTVLQLMRVKGDKVNPDKSKTNFTSGLHVGYFVIPELSIGAELNYQRWLSKPKQPPVEAKNSTADNLSVAIGPRLHLKVGESMWLRPGIAYARFLDKPQGDGDTYDSNHIIQIDVPIAF